MMAEGWPPCCLPLTSDLQIPPGSYEGCSQLSGGDAGTRRQRHEHRRGRYCAPGPRGGRRNSDQVPNLGVQPGPASCP